MKVLFVVSHTESEHHIKRLVGGWFDSELTNKGLEDANLIAAKLLKESKINTLYSSDLKREKATSDAIVQATSARLVLSSSLREMSFGCAEGKTQAWLDKRIQPEGGGNRLDHRIIDGAETRREFASRIYSYLDSLKLEEVSVISTHSFAATFIIAWWIKMPLESIGYVSFDIKPGKITKLEEDDFFKNRTITYLNQ
jgi:probable phosphoglycerate mutase